MELEEIVGVVIKRYRKEKGLSQQELAGDIDSERSYISRLENQGSIIKIDTLIKIAKALGVPPGDIINDIANFKK